MANGLPGPAIALVILPGLWPFVYRFVGPRCDQQVAITRIGRKRSCKRVLMQHRDGVRVVRLVAG
jgi:hypothetical protein